MLRFFAAVLLLAGADGAAAGGTSLRARLVGGGGFEDLATMLAEGIRERTGVAWTRGGGERDGPGSPENPDVVVYLAAPEAELGALLPAHRDGLPAVVLGGALDGGGGLRGEWLDLLGVESTAAGSRYPVLVRAVDPAHPLAGDLTPYWRSPDARIALIEELGGDAVSVAVARARETGRDAVCAWTRTAGRSRVFATSLGRLAATAEDPVFLDLLSRGLLWATGAEPPFDLATPTARKNLALNRPARASAGSGWSGPKVAVDGRIGRAWSAGTGELPQWWEVDLGRPVSLTGCRLYWEREDAAYAYRVEGSRDRETWTVLVNRTGGEGSVAPRFRYDVSADGIRYVRVTVTAIEGGHWAVLGEFEAYGTERVALPARGRRVAGEYDRDEVMNWFEHPEGFEATVFAAPPDVGYPTAVSAAGSGEVYIAEDGNGSLDQTPGRGRIFRCTDEDGDGDADRFDVFADQVDSPRGLFAVGGDVWVMHPPDLSLFRDTDGDGIADERRTLVKGLGFPLSVRGADHATNNIRIAIDGWLYVAVGDYGFKRAVGADGTELGHRGGGVVRVRPDGTELELYAEGLRNIFDVAVDPLLNAFTRDNTNDGGGWNVRVSQIVDGAHYGYPSLFKNFADELLPPLADYGGGSGTGALWLDEPGLPAGYGSALYTCDWGRGVFRHALTRSGAGFRDAQEKVFKFHQPIDMDVDGNSRIYLASWKNGVFRHQRGPVGYVARLTAPGLQPAVFPDLRAAGDASLVEHLASPSQVCRLNTQREILRRGANRALVRGLERLARTPGPEAARAAAVFTLKQFRGERSHGFLVRLAKDDPGMREFALRALADRRGQTRGVPVRLFTDALDDPDPRVRLQAVIGLKRMGIREAAPRIVAMTASPDPVLAHAAYRALVSLQAVGACLEALDDPSPGVFHGALRALRWMPRPDAVRGVAEALERPGSEARHLALIITLLRLYHREAPWEGEFNWWGTRPDTRGPYYDAETWDQSGFIAGAVGRTLEEAPASLRAAAAAEIGRHRIDDGPLAAWARESAGGGAATDDDAGAVAAALASPASGTAEALKDLDYGEVVERAQRAGGDAVLGKRLFKERSCYVCHTVTEGQPPRGPHLGDIGRYSRARLIESIVKPNAKLAQGFETHWFRLADGEEREGFVVREAADEVEIRTIEGERVVIPVGTIARRGTRDVSMMPEGLVKNLTIEELTALLAYLESL